MRKKFKKIIPIGALTLTLLFGAILPIKATITSETDRISYTCNGTTTAYNYTFKIFEDDDILVVRKLTSTGAETTLILTTDYTVSGAGTASGTVTLTAGSTCPSGYTLHLIRNVELTQESDYVEGDTFPADAHEDALDKMAMEAQQLKSRTNRAIKFPVTENTDQVLGTASDRSNKALGFDSSGNLSLLGTSGTGSYSTFLTQENTFTEKQTFSKGIVSPFYNSNYTAAGTDTYTVTITGYTAYTTGDTYLVKFTNANTSTTPTLNISAVGAKTIKKENSAALIAGDISANHESILRYNGVDLILLNPVSLTRIDHNTDGTHKQSSFSVHKNGANQIGIVTGVWTKVTWPNEDWDTNSNFASSTFTPTIVGKYNLKSQVQFVNTTTGSRVNIAIYKNGSLFKESSIDAVVSTPEPVQIDVLVDANGTTDYFEVYIKQSSGSNRDIGGEITITYFQGYKIN